jgi:ankyrin repeat protein
LLRHGADANSRGPLGMTALMIAGDERIVSLLLEHGANANAIDDAGATALMYQAELGSARAVNRLLEAGAGRSGHVRGAACESHAPAIASEGP